jgi:hypothetical protein
MDPDPRGKKWPSSMEKISCLEVLDVLFLLNRRLLL